MAAKKTIYELYEEHETWLNKFLFFKDELKILTDQITEVAEKNTSNELSLLADHFYNQLIIQKEQIDILNHDIKSDVSYLEAAVQKNPNTVYQEKFSDHQKHRESIAVFEKLFKELREELIDFLSK